MIFFAIWGHENLLGTHRNTLEFTKDKDLSPQGDCIIGIKAEFDYDELMDFVNTNYEKKINCKLVFEDQELDSFDFILNKDFCNKHEIVIRKTDFLSGRTLGINASKSSAEISRDFVEIMKDPRNQVKVIFEVK